VTLMLSAKPLDSMRSLSSSRLLLLRSKTTRVSGKQAAVINMQSRAQALHGSGNNELGGKGGPMCRCNPATQHSCMQGLLPHWCIHTTTGKFSPPFGGQVLTCAAEGACQAPAVC